MEINAFSNVLNAVLERKYSDKSILNKEKRNFFARNLQISLISIENQTFSQFNSEENGYFSEKNGNKCHF